MADVQQAVQFVLRQEDSRLSGEITVLPGDRGGPTRFGIASRFHPELVSAGFFDKVDGEPKISHDDALAIAEKVYAEQYSAPLCLTEVASQDVTNRLLSFAINEGVTEAVEIAQRAANSLGAQLDVDGKLGGETLQAINAADPEQLIVANRVFQKQFYTNLVTARPELLPDLKGLLNRAEA